jgi:hypothetical protein
VVIDTAEVAAYDTYCGAIYVLIVIGSDGLVTYHQVTNLLSPDQRQGLIDAIDAALAQ